MSSRKWILSALIPLISLLLTSCSTTRITGTWKDPDARHFRSMLVAAGMENDLLRRLYEDRFATVLQSRGVNAVASYRVFPEMKKLRKEGVEKQVRELGLEGILITRLVETEKVERQRPVFEAYPHLYGYSPFYPYEPFYGFPPYYRSWYPYYGYRYGYTETVRETIFVLETNLYNSDGGNLVWSARSETTTEKRSEEKVEEVAKKIVQQMDRSNLI